MNDTAVLQDGELLLWPSGPVQADGDELTDIPALTFTCRLQGSIPAPASSSTRVAAIGFWLPITRAFRSPAGSIDKASQRSS